MNRREFITKTCVACMSSSLLSTVLISCQSIHYATGILNAKGLTIPKSEFIYTKQGEQQIREYILVNNEKLEFPIYLYRISDNEYTALLMKCTHQGSELQAGGDHLYCTSHGSEFDKRGNVSQGPAEKNLRTFPVSIEGDKIFIELT